MLNYIRAEFYKVFHRKYPWITLGILLALEALLVSGYIFINSGGSHVDLATAVSTICMIMSLGCYMTLITCDMVFAEQYKQSTMKNEVSFGIPRARLFLGKFLVQLMISVLFMVVMIGFYVIFSSLTLYHDPENDLIALAALGECILGSLPVWIGVQALTCACAFLVKSSVAATFVSLGLFSISATVVQLAGLLLSPHAIGQALLKVYMWLPTVMLDRLPDIVGHPEFWPYLGKLCLTGAVWFAASIAVGLAGFSRKEIN